MDAKRVDKIATVVFYVISTFIVVLLGAFILYILYRGGSMLKPSFLFGNPKTTGTGGGIGPELFNSFYMLIISLVITIPIGVGAGIYLAEYAKEGLFLDLLECLWKQYLHFHRLLSVCLDYWFLLLWQAGDIQYLLELCQ